MTDAVEVPEEAVEAAARGLYGEFMYERATSEEQGVWRGDAAAALAAAVPLLRAQWERELRRQIAGEIESLDTATLGFRRPRLRSLGVMVRDRADRRAGRAGWPGTAGVVSGRKSLHEADERANWSLPQPRPLVRHGSCRAVRQLLERLGLPERRIARVQGVQPARRGDDRGGGRR